MKAIAFIDTEIGIKSGKILDIGSVRNDGSSFRSGSVADFVSFLQGTEYICGHNIFKHDLKYLQHAIKAAGIKKPKFIDTLFLSPLLFPTKPYHALLKDDKLQSDDTNNPLNDSIKAKNLFFDEVAAFQQTSGALQHIFYALLKEKEEFSSFFCFLGYGEQEGNDAVNNAVNNAANNTANNAMNALNDAADIENLLLKCFYAQICAQANLTKLIREYPVELAYCLALIATKNRYSITPPWVLKSFPSVTKVMFLLRNNPCLEGCPYCNEALDIHRGLKRFFGYDSYRAFAGEPLQENAVRSAIKNKSLLAVFPTGGGKSLTFQVPALMSGLNSKGLTVVISPLQSLMKDQVDNLESVGITDAVTINGLLDPIERAKSFGRVEDGSAAILYIAPESLRSKTIERLLLGRNIVRFVIDEAHCFSAWGQDFRVDYLYIGDFIKSLQEKKNMEEAIPVSCFTATARQKVIEDIRNYFRDKLALELEVYSAGALRSNLHFQVFEKDNEEEKYNTVRDLIEERDCPTIIYVSRTYRAFKLAQRLTQDGYAARPYHGRMDKQEKTDNQDAFMRGESRIMVATSAFGMGVDKKDVGMVIHYDISDSLENYIQEAGRAGRDAAISADCFILFNDEDLSKHFILHNQTKLSIKEIQQIWKAIKDITKFRSSVSQSALEIARRAGWDENVFEIETRVKTALTALEESGYLKRGHNVPRLYANSINTKNGAEAIERIMASNRFEEKQKTEAIRIIRKLFSTKSRKHANEEVAETRVDYIADHLGIPKKEVIRIITLLREEKILGDAKDLTAFIKRKENQNRSLYVLETFIQIERFLLTVLLDEEQVLNIKELNEQAEKNGCDEVTPGKFKTILNFWAIKSWIKKQAVEYTKNHLVVLCLCGTKTLAARLEKRSELARFIVEYLYQIGAKAAPVEDESQEEFPVEFSVLELKEEFNNRLTMFLEAATLEEVEDALFYLSRIESLKL